MSKLVKIAIIIGTAAVLIAAKQAFPPHSSDSAVSSAARSSIAPGEMMRTIGPLPVTLVDSYFCSCGASVQADAGEPVGCGANRASQPGPHRTLSFIGRASLMAKGALHGSGRLYREGGEVCVELFVQRHDDLAGMRLTRAVRASMFHARRGWA
jgi:hypothetical protein